MDVHEPTATVRECLRFSAKLRQPREVPLKEKYDYCEKVIDLLEMRSLAGATVGSGGSGLNQEQRKRLTIAVELASKPELLLFLDEPTSGLDSLAAYNIVRFLRRLADAGQAVLCTIHQPSAVLFEQFDDLVLLKSGGRVVYHGELGSDCRTLLDYFERNGGKHCPHDANPAEVCLAFPYFLKGKKFTYDTISICWKLLGPEIQITKAKTGQMFGLVLKNANIAHKKSRKSFIHVATKRPAKKQKITENMRCQSGRRSWLLPNAHL